MVDIAYDSFSTLYLPDLIVNAQNSQNW